MSWFGGDYVAAGIAAVLSALVALAAVVIVRTVRGLRIAFSERLHDLPGAGFWRRLGHGLGFWTRVGARVLLLIVLAVYVALALRYVWRLVA